jgi:hypothetical protein
MIALRTLGVALVVAACTWVGEGWCVPIVGAAYALLRRSSAAPIEAGLGAMVAWAVLFLLNAGQPAFQVLLTRLGGVFPLPGVIVLVMAVVFAALLAWSAARLVLGTVGTRV